MKERTVQKINYPVLNGMRAMLIIPNDYYRKKLMPLGPGYISTAMRRCGIDVNITDTSMWSYDDIEIAKEVVQSGVKIFGIGALYPMFKEVKRICNIIRAVVPDATIILGGALPSPIPEFALRETGADIAAIGEAEITIVSLMSALAGEQGLEDVQGISYMKDGAYFNTGKPFLPSEVTKKEVGWPSWDLYPIESYIRTPKFYPFEMNDRVLPIVTGRGCPYACDFCFRVNAYRIRPFDDLLDEMEYLVDTYNLNGFYIVDDLLMLSENKIRSFCEGILQRGIKIKYNCSGRVNTVTPEIARLLKASGCIAVYYGLESGNQRILETMSKKTTVKQIYEAVQLTRENNIYCEYGLMFGQPGENEETLQDTVQLIKNISYGHYRAQKIFGCVPFPGTGLYEWCKQTGRIKDDKDFHDRYICQDWSLDQIPVNMTDLPDETLQRMFKKANAELSEFYRQQMSKNWVKVFGGNIEAFRKSPKGRNTLHHLAERVEASASTYDTRGS
jgi:radical SAM superfamily enzyme YgiQ (UPF0313 family)